MKETRMDRQPTIVGERIALRPLREAEVAMMAEGCAHYLELAAHHAAALLSGDQDR